MEVFPHYVYDQPSRGSDLPMAQDGKWKYATGACRTLDREKFEDWKTRFYKFEGYNPENGYPTEKILEKMDLHKVAQFLKRRRRPG